MTAIALRAPLAGWLAPLTEVPDPVFADGMMGEGFAIDPTEGLVRAPCEAVVAAVAPTGHSVTLTVGSASLLIHIGVDTVALAGQGFEACVRPGAKVAAGDMLIAFDLDQVARAAKSVMTPIVLVEGGTIVVGTRDRLVGFDDVIATLTPAAPAASATASIGDTALRTITVPLAHGIHARPAARLVDALKAFNATAALHRDGRQANARSVVSLMALGVREGEEIVLSAEGPDAQAAVDAMAHLLLTMTETHAPSPVLDAAELRGQDTPSLRVPGQEASPHASDAIPGISAAPGVAIGRAWHLRAPEILVPCDALDPTLERAHLAAAIAAVRGRLSTAHGMAGEIAAAHMALLDDVQLTQDAEAGIAAGRSAGHAWRQSVRAAARAIAATGDARLVARVADFDDIERQVLAALTGTPPARPDPPGQAILIADDLLPSAFMAMPPGRLAGIATARGGPTSHVAILAASAGLPMLVALGPGVLEIAEGTTLVLDADAGTLATTPALDQLATVAARLTHARGQRAQATAAAHDEARTTDGTRIEVFANLGSLDDAIAAVAAGAEGCGLLRTEFLFQDRDTAPGEDEQANIYARIAAALGDRVLILRLLDIGGDKPVAYLEQPREENPALGVRGVRLGLARPDLLRTQLRAALRGLAAGRGRIMVPMIVDAAELAAVRAMLDAAAADLAIAAPPLGVMIETPAAAMLGDGIATHADFLSIGTNDLTQYALACDRGNPGVAAKLDALHPAVLRLIAEATRGAALHDRPVGVCGGLASDPSAVAILIGLGVTELSATASAIPAIKAAVRGVSLDHCRALAAAALACASPQAVRALLREDIR